MNEFINDLGKDNLIIIISVIGAIVLALIIILVIERIQRKKHQDNLEYYDDLEKPAEKIFYKEKEPTEEEAKKKLDDAAKKLVLEEQLKQDIINHTNFELEQEEKSVISYDELVKISNDVDERNDILLKDEGTEPITIEELYKKHLEEQEEIDVLDNPVFEEDKEELKKFKNSEIISPVFGVYKNITKTRYESDDLEKTVDLEDLETEIRKTEEFLKELKKLKNKLD